MEQLSEQSETPIRKPRRIKKMIASSEPEPLSVPEPQPLSTPIQSVKKIRRIKKDVPQTEKPAPGPVESASKPRRIKKDSAPSDPEAEMRKELTENFRNPEKLATLARVFDEARAEKKIKDKEIAEIKASIKAPKAQKKELIEMIREMVTDPVDRLNMRLEKKSKGDLQTAFNNIKAQYEWHKKNKPGLHTNSYEYVF